MNHNKSYRKLGRRTDHRLAMLNNLTKSLLKEERIKNNQSIHKETKILK